MKKLMAALIALMLIALPALGEGEWYITRANEMAQQMSALANDEAYISAYYSSELDALQKFASADLTQPIEAWRIDLPAGSEWANAIGSGLGKTFDETALDAIHATIGNVLFSMIIGSHGSDEMVVNSLLTVDKSERLPDDFSEQLWLLDYGDAMLGASFAQTGADSITISLHPLPGTALEDIAGMAANLAPLSMKPVPVEFGALDAPKAEAEFIQDDLREETARELAEKMIALAGNEDYIAACGLEDEPQFLPDLANAGSLKNEWHYVAASTALTRKALSAIFGDTLSDAALDKMVRSSASTGVSVAAGQVSAAALRESSFVSTTKTIRIPEDFKNSMIILEYDSALIAVSFAQTGADTATATAAPIFTDGSTNAETAANNVAMASLMTFEE